MKKTIIAAMAVQWAWLAAAQAAPPYDRQLEDAAKRVVAERIGEVKAVLRGTFAAGQTPEYSQPRPRLLLHAVRHARPLWNHGLAPAIEPRAVRQVSVDRIVFTGSVIAQD